MQRVIPNGRVVPVFTWRYFDQLLWCCSYPLPAKLMMDKQLVDCYPTLLTNNEWAYFTDSGRSSLRIILDNIGGRFKAAKADVWLPTICCDLVVSMFKSRGFTIKRYPVTFDGARFQASYPKQKLKDSILFTIDYFGLSNYACSLYPNFGYVIESNCLVNDFITPGASTYEWYGYNSWRKVLNTYAGSIIKSNRELIFDYKPMGGSESWMAKYHAAFRETSNKRTGMINVARIFLETDGGIYYPPADCIGEYLSYCGGRFASFDPVLIPTEEVANKKAALNFPWLWPSYINGEVIESNIMLIPTGYWLKKKVTFV